MELTIEKMIYGGDGLARMPGNGAGRTKTVFVPFVLAGEQVSAVVTEEKAGFNRARPGHIVAASPHRGEPRCPYFFSCGGCHYQHSDYENQLVIKRDILLETLRRMARIEWKGEIAMHPSPPFEYRNRTRLHVQAEPFALGYFRHASRDLLPVEQCPISSLLIQRAIREVWKLGRAGEVPADAREIEFFVSAEDDKLLIEVYSAYESGQDQQAVLERFARQMAAAMPEVAGTLAFAMGSSLFPWYAATWHSGATALDYRTQAGKYRVSGGSFFQVNRFLTDALVHAAVSEENGANALDLYAGVGLFTAVLARNFQRVTAVEASPRAIEDMQANVPPTVDRYQLTTEEFLRRHSPTLRPEFVVVDPPRAGLEPRVTQTLLKLAAPRLTYVSCDPATLSRDLRPLTDHGYRVREIHLLDMFPQTFHLETVVKLELR